MNSKVFSQRFNKELSTLGLPDALDEKTKAIVKIFGVKSHLAKAMLFGDMLPSPEDLEKIASILEVCPQWLSGKTHIGGKIQRKKSQACKEPAE